MDHLPQLRAGGDPSIGDGCTERTAEGELSGLVEDLHSILEWTEQFTAQTSTPFHTVLYTAGSLKKPSDADVATSFANWIGWLGASFIGVGSA